MVFLRLFCDYFRYMCGLKCTSKTAMKDNINDNIKILQHKRSTPHMCDLGKVALQKQTAAHNVHQQSFPRRNDEASLSFRRSAQMECFYVHDETRDH